MNGRAIFETVASAALLGMGIAGIVSPDGIGQSSFFPALRSSIHPVLIGAFLFALGGLRLLLLRSSNRYALRAALAGLSAFVWGQWAMGFFLASQSGTMRPGAMQLGAFVLGELMLIHAIANDAAKGKVRR